MQRSDFLYQGFIKAFRFEPTPCQDAFFHAAAAFLCSDDEDIMVVNGYAGTGKTSALAAIIAFLGSVKSPVELMAPTGRAAKVLSQYSGRPAHTIHKQIYKQKSVNDNGMGLFSLVPNKSGHTLFIVDECSLIGIDSQGQSTSFGSGNLLEDLVSYVRNGNECKLMLVGDSAQLPPIGLELSPALSLAYMSGFSGVCSCSLSTVVRQKQESGILHNATILRKRIEEMAFDEIVDDLKLETDGYDDVERISGGELIDALTDAFARFGDDSTVVLSRSNKRAIRYNLGIRSTVQFKEEQLLRGDRLMIVKNNYKFVEDIEGIDYLANGDMAKLVKIGHFEERYGLHFADAVLCFPDYDDLEVSAKVILDCLQSESASITYEQQNALYHGVDADYSHITGKRKRYSAVKEDKYFNAIQLKYADAITCHKSQGGQWDCVFVDNPFWQDGQSLDDLKWLYTALTRAVRKVYLVNFKDTMFE